MSNTLKIPNGWQKVFLKEIIELEYGKSLPTATRVEKGKYIVYGSNGPVGNHDSFLIEGPAIIVGRKGSAGAVHYSQSNCWPIDTTYFVRNWEALNIKCIYYLLSSLNLKSLDKSTAIPGLNRNDAYDIAVLLPPLEEQHRIVNKIEELFSELDNGVSTLKKALHQLRVYRQALLKRAFEGKLTRKEIKEGLPEEWKWVKLSEICDIIGGVTKGRDFKGKDTIQLPYLRVANVQDGFLDLEEVKTIDVLPSDKEKYKLEYGDILYTEGGDKDKLGRGTIWRNEIADCIHQNHIFRARPISEEVDPKYVAYFSQTKYAKDYFFRKAKQTTNLASINITVLSNLPIPICSFNEQRKIVLELERLLSVCDNLEQTITQNLQESEALRRSILKKAFEGDLVAQDPYEEPAHELLKRLQAEKAKYYETIKLKSKIQLKPPTMRKTLIEVLSENFKKEAFTYEEMKSKVALPYNDLKAQLFELLDNGDSLEAEFDSEKEKILFKVKK